MSTVIRFCRIAACLAVILVSMSFAGLGLLALVGDHVGWQNTWEFISLIAATAGLVVGAFTIRLIVRWFNRRDGARPPGAH
ncbi:MAG: hypothetical protein HY290_32720 [Planctomycetia bacterium]|nr:hypothetical protein [Planctomycetia bacterium]